MIGDRRIIGTKIELRKQEKLFDPGQVDIKFQQQVFTITVQLNETNLLGCEQKFTVTHCLAAGYREKMSL